MLIHDRRRCRAPAANEIRVLLNSTQLASLSRLEREGWRLRFVRKEPALPPVPIVAMRDNSHAVLRADGQLDDASVLDIRD